MRQKKHKTNIKPAMDDIIDSPKAPIRLIVDNVRSLYNIGSMFRTSDACRIEHIHLCGICGTPPRKEIKKTALETVKAVPWSYHEKTLDAVNELKKSGYTIYAMEICDTSEVFDEVKYKFPCALVVGHEIDGVSDEVLEACDHAIHIPMYGIGVSINVASAVAVGLVEIRRAWDGKTAYSV